jgi:chemotaxis protein CheC
MAEELLNTLETDLLTELFNIGIGRAANSLSLLVKQEVKLTVPSVKFISMQEMTSHFGMDELSCGVGQKMQGDFEAYSLLLFSESGSKEVVRSMLGDTLPDEMIVEMQQEAMNEIGNIVLNACIGSVSNSMSSTIDVGIPKFFHDKTENIINVNTGKEGNDHTVLLITIDMILSQSNIKGYMVFLLEPLSITKLRKQLKKMLLEFA